MPGPAIRSPTGSVDHRTMRRMRVSCLVRCAQPSSSRRSTRLSSCSRLWRASSGRQPGLKSSSWTTRRPTALPRRSPSGIPRSVSSETSATSASAQQSTAPRSPSRETCSCSSTTTSSASPSSSSGCSRRSPTRPSAWSPACCCRRRRRTGSIPPASSSTRPCGRGITSGTSRPRCSRAPVTRLAPAAVRPPTASARSRSSAASTRRSSRTGRTSTSRFASAARAGGARSRPTPAHCTSTARHSERRHRRPGGSRRSAVATCSPSTASRAAVR